MKKILLIGGGTGGHIIPLRNLAEELSAKKCQAEIIVSDSDLDKKIAQENFSRDFKVHYFKTDKIRRYLSWRNIFAPFKIVKSIFSAKKLLTEIKPDVVFFKGGFVGFPFLMALTFSNFRGKIYGHESDIETGKLTKLLSQVANKIFYSFGDPAYPLFFSDQNPAKNKKVKNKNPKLLVFGGSQGAQFINELICDNLEKLTKKFAVFLVTGVEKSIDSPLRKGARGISFQQTEMLTAPELREKITEADLIISRAGANSLFEIISTKKPSLIIPLPSAAKNHQEKNAQFFAKKGLCHIFHQEKNTHFYDKVLETFEDKKLRENLKKSDIQNSAKKIAKEIIR